MAAAHSFFDAYKELFEYEKFVGEEDPTTLSQRDGIGAKTFLDKYRECEQRQALELHANVQIPLVSALAVDTAMLTRPPQHVFQPQQVFQYFSSAAATPQPFASVSPGGGGAAHPSASIPPSLTRSRLESSLRQSAISSDNQEEAAPAALWPHLSPQAPPERTSPTKAGVVLGSEYLPLEAFTRPNSAHLLQQQQPDTVRAAPHARTTHQVPKLASLLLDSSTRSSTLRHRHLDEAKKIELLIGANFGGRFSSASTNLPPAIRRRLQASARLEQRRERLYATLRQHYQSICSPAH